MQDARSAATVSSLAIECLRSLNVEYVFGVPGRSVHYLLRELAFAESRGAGGPRFVVGRHEGASAFMADGYARTSGRLGVCLVSAGPGATNAATGVLCAQADHSPLLLLSGECPTSDFTRGAFQCGATPDANVVRMFEAITARSRLLTNPDNILEELIVATTLALSIPHQAVHLSVPVDVSAMPAPLGTFPTLSLAQPPPANESQLDAAIAQLLRAKRPLILLGYGAAPALTGAAGEQLLERFTRLVVERHKIPVATTPKAKGLFPEDHELSLGTSGMAGSEWLLRYLKASTHWPDAAPYDALFVIGSGLTQWATAGFDPAMVPAGPLFQVDCDTRVFGRAYPTTQGIVGDTAHALQRWVQVAEATAPSSQAQTHARHAFIKERVKAVPSWLDAETRESDAHPVLPQRVMAELQHVLDSPFALARGVNLFCDIGNCTGWVWHHLQIRPPHRAFFNTAMGSMGWASGAVLGGKLGDPGRLALAVSGDGAFFMNGSEVSTALQYRIPAVWLILQDDNMAMVSHGMNATHASPSSSGWASHYALGDSDLVALAAGLGADAYAASAPGDVAELLPGLLRACELRQKPQVLVVRIDAFEAPPYPHLRNKKRT